MKKSSVSMVAIVFAILVVLAPINVQAASKSKTTVQGDFFRTALITRANSFINRGGGNALVGLSDLMLSTVSQKMILKEVKRQQDAVSPSIRSIKKFRGAILEERNRIAADLNEQKKAIASLYKKVKDTSTSGLTKKQLATNNFTTQGRSGAVVHTFVLLNSDRLTDLISWMQSFSELLKERIGKSKDDSLNSQLNTYQTKLSSADAHVRAALNIVQGIKPGQSDEVLFKNKLEEAQDRIKKARQDIVEARSALSVILTGTTSVDEYVSS